MGTFMLLIDTTIVLVALPDIANNHDRDVHRQHECGCGNHDQGPPLLIRLHHVVPDGVGRELAFGHLDLLDRYSGARVTKWLRS